jgi:DNA-binding transcriptional MerR regulator
VPRIRRDAADAPLLRAEGTAAPGAPRLDSPVQLPRGKKVGFALEEIKEMLDLYNLRDGQLTQLRIASTKMRERLEALRAQRVELEDAIADLERTVVVVDGMLKEREAAGPEAASN